MLSRGPPSAIAAQPALNHPPRHVAAVLLWPPARAHHSRHEEDGEALAQRRHQVDDGRGGVCTQLGHEARRRLRHRRVRSSHLASIGQHVLGQNAALALPVGADGKFEALARLHVKVAMQRDTVVGKQFLGERAVHYNQDAAVDAIVDVRPEERTELLACIGSCSVHGGVRVKLRAAIGPEAAQCSHQRGVGLRGRSQRRTGRAPRSFVRHRR